MESYLQQRWVVFDWKMSEEKSEFNTRNEAVDRLADYRRDFGRDATRHMRVEPKVYRRWR